MILKRSSGILLHPTSLPGSPGIGTIGSPAFHFIDWLHEAGQSLWQMLPFGPTGYGDSPYASLSTFAGNPLLIDLDLLEQQGLLTIEEIQLPKNIQSDSPVDYGSVINWKFPLLKLAAERFLSWPKPEDFSPFKKKNSYWLDDYALFIDIKQYFDFVASQNNLTGQLWGNYWPEGLKKHVPMAVSTWESEHTESVEIQRIIQYFFFTQWDSLKKYANSKGISIIGDIPIFVAYDSADVWANKKFFQLDKDCSPTFVAGVPPDYFSTTGQLWGNPLYNWKKMRSNRYAWWKKRISFMHTHFDYVRIDHFRGFETYWSIPAGSENAINGKWLKGPGADFFKHLKASLGDLPILAEDLGIITTEVGKLRDDFNLPGMKILQFAFDPNEANTYMTNAFLPHMYSNNCIVYTGTHDNDTMQGWIDKSSKDEIDMIRDYLGLDKADKRKLVPELIRMALMSSASFAIFPLQDIYCLGSDSRINTPSTTGNNWKWRMSTNLLDQEKKLWLRKLSAMYGRNVT